MKTKAILISLMVFLVTRLAAQNSEAAMELPEITDSSVFQSANLAKPDKKLHTGVNLDMSYVFSKYYSGPVMNFSPYVSYPVTERLSLAVGISAGYGAIYSPYFYQQEQGTNKLMPMTRAYIFASGNYMINKKFILTGSAYKGINTVPNLNRQRVSADYNFSGASVGFNYKIAPGFTFGAEININSRGTYPWGMNSSIPGNGYYNPYGW